ncbi:Ubiquitin-conjugating enzyme E2 [Arachis hypogaea]|nr:Ubiquitin-conjugating enzyme E2 [Arachis hypogaea]
MKTPTEPNRTVSLSGLCTGAPTFLQHLPAPARGRSSHHLEAFLPTPKPHQAPRIPRSPSHSQHHPHRLAPNSSTAPRHHPLTQDHPADRAESTISGHHPLTQQASTAPHHHPAAFLATHSTAPPSLPPSHQCKSDMDPELPSGYYYGKIKFPPKYPYKSPGISMTTPNGRFMTQKKICLSMSDFHLESWNPMWSVSRSN